MYPCTLTLTIADAATMAVVTAALGLAGKEAASAPTPKPAPAPAAVAGKNTAKEPAADAPAKTASAPLPAAESAAAPAPASTAATDEPLTYDKDVKPLILKISTTKSRDVLVAALGKFNVARGPELKPEQYAGFVAHARELLADGVPA